MMVDTAAILEGERDMPTLEHGDVIAALIAALRPYVLAHRLGRVFAPQTTYHLFGIPDREVDNQTAGRHTLHGR